MKLKKILFLLVSILPFATEAQNLTGVWRGNFVSRYFGMYGDRYKFEVQLIQNANEFKGVTYSYRTTVFYGKADMVGRLNNGGRDVVIRETRLVEVKMQQNTVPCIMTCYMRYYTKGGEEFLEGKYTSINYYNKEDCGSGTVFLTKVRESDFKKEKFLLNLPTPPKPLKPVTNPVKTNPANPGPGKTNPPVVRPQLPKPKPQPPKSDTPSLTKINNNPANKVSPDKQPGKQPGIQINNLPTPAILKSRENKLVRTIYSDETEIRLDIYDNGEIDGDTISVYVDKKLVLSKKRLTASPLTITVKVDKDNPVHEVVMVAENLGEIPPNTSLMVVRAGEKRYEVRIESTEQKNALVRFEYKPGE